MINLSHCQVGTCHADTTASDAALEILEVEHLKVCRDHLAPLRDFYPGLANKIEGSKHLQHPLAKY